MHNENKAMAIKAHCIDVRYSVSEAETIYRLAYADGVYRDITAIGLKHIIKKGEVIVDNIKLGKNNRLYIKKSSDDYIGSQF